MIQADKAIPLVLIVLSMFGMMTVFMSEGAGVPALVPVLIVIAALVLVNALRIEWRARRTGLKPSLPRWALPLAGTVGGLAACAQMAIYLANQLQQEPVEWFLHVPGATVLIGLAGTIHVAWRN